MANIIETNGCTQAANNKIPAPLLHVLNVPNWCNQQWGLLAAFKFLESQCTYMRFPCNTRPISRHELTSLCLKKKLARKTSYLEIMNLLVFWNMFIFLQSCSSDERRQLRISKEFKRLPDSHRRLASAQLHAQGCEQQIALPALVPGAVPRSVRCPGLPGRHAAVEAAARPRPAVSHSGCPGGADHAAA